MLRALNENKRRLYRMLIALSMAFVVNAFYSFSHQWWLPLAAFFVMLTDTGCSIYQGIQRYVLLLVVVSAVSWGFSPLEVMHWRIYDVTLGAFIGIVVNAAIFPDQVDVLFRQSIAFVLKEDAEYFQAIIHLLLMTVSADATPLDPKKAFAQAEDIKRKVEQGWQRLPLWVYETGFDLALQKGYRHFLMKVSEVGEVLFSLHHLARYPFSSQMLTVIAEPLRQCAEKAQAFFTALIHVLDLKRDSVEAPDFYQDLEAMEKAFKQMVPLDPQVLDVSKEAVYLIEFIYVLRELQDLLIKMADALRESETRTCQP